VQLLIRLLNNLLPLFPFPFLLLLMLLLLHSKFLRGLDMECHQLEQTLLLR
jgi:hypothetical protein